GGFGVRLLFLVIFELLAGRSERFDRNIAVSGRATLPFLNGHQVVFDALLGRRRLGRGWSIGVVRIVSSRVAGIPASPERVAVVPFVVRRRSLVTLARHMAAATAMSERRGREGEITDHCGTKGRPECFLSGSTGKKWS